MPFLNRIRLPFFLGKAQFPSERNVFRKADGSSKVLSAIIRNTYKGLTDYLPEDWHRKLVIALNHDNVNIESDNLATDVVIDSEYEIEWPDFKNYPVAQAGFTVQSTPFNASNSNCQTCEEVSQLSLVDDEFSGFLTEGQTAVYPDVTDNDSICCYPAVLSISWFDTTYLLSATLTQLGELTVVLQNPTPFSTNTKLVTYRATCPDKTYDEADVYADVEGSAVGCNCASNLVFTLITDLSATATWDAAVPAPAVGYIWNLYDASNPVTALQSGTTAGLTINLTGLVADFTYLFQVQSDCDGTISDCVAQGEFTTIGNNNNCGEFFVSFLTATEEYIGGYTYIDCNGVTQTETILANSVPVSKCMLITAGEEVPYYFTSSHPDLIWEYDSLC